MKNQRISTTISQKHWELLKKHAEVIGTHQKVLQLALESLDSHSIPEQSAENELWARMGRELKNVCMVQRELLKVAVENSDIEIIIKYMASENTLSYMTEYYCRKPLKKCSLKEVMNAVVISGRVANWFDAVNYTDDGKYYTINIGHSLGLNHSKLSKTLLETLFETYGVKTDSEISDRSIFVRVYKNT
jgi:hypothetical protein